MNHSEKIITMSRRVVIAVALSLGLATTPSFAAGDPGKIGVVDYGKIFNQLPDTKQAQATMQATTEPIQKELARLNVEYQKAIAAFNQLPASASKAVKEQKGKDAQLKGQTLQKYQQEQSLALQKKDQELDSQIKEKITKAVESIAQKEGFSLVLEKNATHYSTPEYDLTYKVIDQLNINK